MLSYQKEGFDVNRYATYRIGMILGPKPLRNRNPVPWRTRFHFAHTSYLLGGWSGPSKDGLFEGWKPNAEMINATIRFPVNTTRLNYKRGEETSPDPTASPSSLD